MLFLALLLSGRVQSFASSPPGIKNAVIFLIRHAEKPENGPLLSADGEKRAVKYVEYFKSLRLDRIFAADNSKNSQRSRDTVAPLAQAFQIKVNSSFKDRQIQELCSELKSGRYSGRNVLVCWHHGTMPEMLRALGADPERLLPTGKWPSDVFGWLIELRFDKDGMLKARVINENLMPEDAKHPQPPIPQS